ncbi:hypothetical protein ONE63_008829 [Megalurothrips usitatus]|uniref:Phosphatidylinositol-3-phosphatase SAC1 n=1 Tax=Megalurothrips usitatus TaxID=439358 RepID=A0AAV7XU06_9NEOP|nr:hypothetical protein ONE63_008829 [Megalurothrips usitatus]
MASEVYRELKLYITPEKFFVEPVSGNGNLMVIDRVSQDISLQVNKGQIPPSSSCKVISGIMGTVRLLAGNYLVVILGKKHIGTINGQPVFQVTETEVISYSRTLLHLTENQMADNKMYVSMLEHALSSPFLYFSYTYDLTHTLQRLHNITPEFLKMALHERADQRFLWNGHLLREISNHPDVHSFFVPVMHGFISINQYTIQGKAFTWTVVSRRSRFRSGTRLFMRGIDSQGNVANFVETEQIVESNGDRYSFVQTRGSIPLFWHQLPNLKYKPKPALILGENHAEAATRHFNTQIFNYGRQVLVNLIDHRGAEDVLEKAYSNIVSQVSNPNIRYEAFDFHAECSKMRWDRLSILLDRLAHEQDELSMFLLTRDGTLVSQQEGVFRTNCIDCLDRTNVVQSMLAKRSLTNALQKLAILPAGRQVEDEYGLEVLFRSVWADNADYMSIQYSGTGALKTDFTRTGKRTRVGLLKDGLNSMIRYCKNNFMDGFRQDSIDLLLGNYMVEDGEGVTRPCPLEAPKGWRYLTFPLILLVAIAMFFASIITPSELTTAVLLYILFWGVMVMVTSSLIMFYGTEYVDYPKLNDLKKSQ